MKKTYETPSVEKIAFQYRDQVVVASGNCISAWKNEGDNACKEGNPEHVEYLN